MLGSYAQGNLLPNIPKVLKLPGKEFLQIMELPQKELQKNLNLNFVQLNENDIINSKEINTVFIATRHDSHASLCIKGFKE